MSLLKSLLLSLMALAGAATAAHAVDTTIDFSPSSVGPNQTSRMTISFTNPLGSPITDLSLVKDLPGIFIANPDQATTTCAGAKVTLTNTDTGGQVAIANAEVPINTTNSGVCTVAFDTTTKTRGARIVTIRAGEVVATQNGGPTTNPQDGSGTLSTVFLNPTVTLSSPHGSHTSAGEVAIIHLTITNPNTTAMTGVGVSLSPSTLFPSHGALLGVVPGTLEGSTCAITGSADPTQGSRSPI